MFIQLCDKIMYSWFRSIKMMLWPKNEDMHTENFFWRFPYLFNNCCAIYIFLVYIYRFMRIFCESYWISLAPQAWKKYQIFSVMLNEIINFMPVFNKVLIIFNVCEFPLYCVVNKIVTLLIKLTYITRFTIPISYPK